MGSANHENEISVSKQQASTASGLVNRRTLLRCIFGAAASMPVMSLLAACGTTSAKTSKTSSTTAAHTGGTAVQAGSSPVSKSGASSTGTASIETITVSWDQDPDNLDPQTARGNKNWWVLQDIYDTLTYLPGGNLSASPLLATSWEASTDGKTYTFKLRQGVKFSTGNELNAEAVKFSMDRLTMIGLGPLYMTSSYKSTEVVDKYTVKMTLNFPYPAWLTIISNPAVAGIIDPAFVKAHGPDKANTRNNYVSTHTAGAGAYMLSQWQQGQQIVLTRNPNYWRGWSGNHPKQVILQTVPEQETRTLSIQKGSVDTATIVVSSLPSFLQQVKGNNLPVVVPTTQGGKPLLSLKTTWLDLNNKMLPTSDINVRKALNYSFNYDLYIQKVLFGYAFRMEGMIPRGVLGHVSDYPSYEFDLDKAKMYLGKASPAAKKALANGLPLKYMPGYVLQQNGALMWQSDLAKIGIKLNIQEIDQATLTTLQTSAPGVPIVESLWSPDYPDADDFINAAKTSYWPPKGYGAAFAGDAETDKLIQQGVEEQDPDKRKAIYRQLELYFHDQASIIMLAELSGTLNEWNAHLTSLQGLEYNPMFHPMYYNCY